MTTTNYSWDIGIKGQKPYWNEWSELWTNVDTELYKRSKDLYMQNHELYGSEDSGGDLKLHSTGHAAKGKIYFGANDYVDETTGFIYRGNVRIHDYHDPGDEGYNLFMGVSAGNFTLASGGLGASYASYNTGFGSNVLPALTTGNNNCALGASALANDTTGGYNIAMGVNALQVNTTGENNAALGEGSMLRNISGTGNTGVGADTLAYNTSGNNNVAIGIYALLSNTVGDNHVAIGSNALYLATSVSPNIAVGPSALYNITTGGNNIALGSEAGRYITDGSTPNQTSAQSLYFGVATRALANGDANEIVIGYGTTGIGSNSVILGNSSITKTRLQGKIGIGTSTPLGDFSIFTEGLTKGIMAQYSGIGTSNIVGTFNVGSGYQADSWSNMSFVSFVTTWSGSGTDSVIRFYAGHGGVWAGEAMRIDRDGNLGINDTAPGEKLDVNGNINATGVIKIDDVQILSNRVIDARCDDVINSGDSATDGVIDALRDAMIAHGLIAAA